MARIQYIDDVLGNFQETHGSDSRLNVSSRSDGRGYYNSRDESESYSLLFDDANATALDFVVYLKNDKTDGKHLVLECITVNAEVNMKVSLHTVTGTAGGGTAQAPVNLNFAGVAKTSTSTALTTADSGITPMTGLTVDKEIDHVNILANGHEEFNFKDQVRLGQDQAVAVRMDAGTNDSQLFGVIYYFFE